VLAEVIAAPGAGASAAAEVEVLAEVLAVAAAAMFSSNLALAPTLSNSSVGEHGAAVGRAPALEEAAAAEGVSAEAAADEGGALKAAMRSASDATTNRRSPTASSSWAFDSISTPGSSASALSSLMILFW
jgi:hypothetical protein